MSTVVVSGTSSGHGTCLNTIQRTNSSAEAAPGSANQRRVLPDSSRPPPRWVQLVCIWSSATINSELQLKFATILQILHAWLRPAAGFPTRIARIWEFIWTEEMSFIYKPNCYIRYIFNDFEKFICWHLASWKQQGSELRKIKVVAADFNKSDRKNGDQCALSSLHHASHSMFQRGVH